MKIWNVLIVMVSLILLTACGAVQEEYEDVELQADERFADDDLVMTINGEEVSGKQYNDMYLRVKTQAVRAEDAAANEPETLRKETFTLLEQNYLFLQLAATNGIVIDDAEKEADLKQLKKLDEAGYRELMNKYNYTEEAIAQEIQLEKVRKQYIDQFVSVSVTDEEVKAFYDETVATTDEELPDYDSAYKSLKERLEVKKALEDVAEQVEAFKSTSEITIHK